MLCVHMLTHALFLAAFVFTVGIMYTGIRRQCLSKILVFWTEGCSAVVVAQGARLGVPLG